MTKTQLCKEGQIISEDILGIIVDKIGDVTTLYQHLQDCEKCAELANTKAKNTLRAEKNKWVSHTICKGNICIYCEINSETQQIKIDPETFRNIFPLSHVYTTLNIQFLRNNDWVV